MLKAIISVFASIIVAATALASPTGTRMGDQVIVPMSEADKSNGETTSRPRAPALRLFSAFVDTDSDALFVSSRYDVGEVSATIENISTGEFYSYTFDSADTALLPIACTNGLWSVRLTLEGGAEFVGEFQL